MLSRDPEIVFISPSVTTYFAAAVSVEYLGDYGPCWEE